MIESEHLLLTFFLVLLCKGKACLGILHSRPLGLSLQLPHEGDHSGYLLPHSSS